MHPWRCNALFDERVRAMLLPDRNILAVALSHPQRHDGMRHALVRIAALPPAITIPALMALERWRMFRTNAHDAASGLAHALRIHGDLALAIADALNDDDGLRAALLPLPTDPALANAIRALTQDDLDAGRRIVLAAPRPHADAIATTLLDDDRMALLSNAAPVASALAVDGQTDDLNAAFWRIARNDVLCALALATLDPDAPDERNQGVAVLAAAPQTMRTLAPMLRSDVHDILRAHPVLAAALADLDDDPPSAHPTRGMLGAIRRRA